MSGDLTINTALSEHERTKLIALGLGRLVLELGAQFGASTICLAQEAQRVWSVDWHRGDADAGQIFSGYNYLSNLIAMRVLDKVVPIVGRFEDVLPMLKGPFDLIFLDGAHDADSVERDLGLIFWLLADDGILACHDHGRFGVEEGLRRSGLWRVMETVDSLAICTRRGVTA